MNIPIHYGRTLLPEALPPKKRWLVITTHPILDMVMDRLKGLTAQIHTDPDMEEEALAAWAGKLATSEAVLGIGGGVCMDAAKYISWKRGLPLWLAPSVISVDAPLTDSIAIRRRKKVHYIGKAIPESVLIDFSLVQSAPYHLNRAGAGDILSIHTALWDWDLAARENQESYDASVARQSAQLLDRLDMAAEEIANVTEEGIQILVELYAEEVDLCMQIQSSRPEEGSEHFWAYNAEFRTQRDFVHGELVVLGVLLMSGHQENDLDRALSLARRLQVRHLPEQIGMTRDEVLDSLITAREYALKENLAYSVLNARPLTPSQADNLLGKIG